MAAADDAVPDVNHFVLLTADDHSEVVDLTLEDIDTARKARSAISHTESCKGGIAAFYAASGHVVQFTVAQGDCGPDAVALHTGLPSDPATWKSIRLAVADHMCSLQHIEWFRACFCSCQEYDPEQIVPEVVDSPSQPHVSESEEDNAAPTEETAKRDAVRWMIGSVGGSTLGARSVPAGTLDGYVASMSPDEIGDIVNAHTHIASKKKQRCKLQQHKSAMLSVRRAVGRAYLEFLPGAVVE